MTLPGLYQLREAISCSLVIDGLDADRQGVIPAGTLLAVVDREGREAEAEDVPNLSIDLADCEFLCSLQSEEEKGDGI